MAPDERARAGRAVADRIVELQTAVTTVARAADIDPRTLRALINGSRWPGARVRARINRALQWPSGELELRAQGSPALRDFRTTDLLLEVVRRVEILEAASSAR